MISIERSVTSQNGEDGIIDFMISHVINPNRCFLEIGWGDGKHNMSYNLISQGWTGNGVDLLPCIVQLPPSVNFFQEPVNPSNLKKFLVNLPLDFDFFSLDIDSFDFEISKKLLDENYRPKIVCVEINKRFGKHIEASFPYVHNSNKKTYHKAYRSGVSLKKYLNLWQSAGYTFLTCDSTYTNAFFYHPESLRQPVVDDALGLSEMPFDEDSLYEKLKESEYWKDKLESIYTKYEG